jgi:hypothetical protein
MVIGSIAGTVRKSRRQYRKIKLFGKVYYAHRLVWFYHYGVFPTYMLDHKDGDSLNNRLDNLREATVFNNSHNVKISKKNKTGYKGVFLCKKTGKYRAQININGKTKWLGYFVTAISASEAYETVAKEVHGEYYRDTQS